MRILFLDIDGVLNSYQWYKGHKKYPLNPYCVSLLNKIIDETNAKVVISSAWRVSMTGTLKCLKRAGFNGEVIGSTPFFMMDEWRDDKSRGAEINQWLSLNKGIEIENYIILDDRKDFTEDQLSHTIIIDRNTGITEKDANTAIIMLNKNIKFEIDGKIYN